MTTCVIVVDCPLVLVVNTVVKDLGTVVIVFPAELVVVKVIGPVREDGLSEEEVAERVIPVERAVMESLVLGLALDREEAG